MTFFHCELLKCIYLGVMNGLCKNKGFTKFWSHNFHRSHIPSPKHLKSQFVCITILGYQILFSLAIQRPPNVLALQRKTLTCTSLNMPQSPQFIFCHCTGALNVVFDKLLSIILTKLLLTLFHLF